MATITNYTSPCSRHPGGVQLLLCDESARFVSESVDWMGVWRPLATVAGSEVLDSFDPSITTPRSTIAKRGIGLYRPIYCQTLADAAEARATGRFIALRLKSTSSRQYVTIHKSGEENVLNPRI